MDRIVKLEQELKSFKASQLLGSSSARIVPVYNVDISFTMSMLAWVSFRYSTDSVINPIITPRLTVLVDGQPAVRGSSTYAGISYDDYMVAINFEQATGTFILPNEKSAGLTIMLDSSDWGNTHTVVIQGALYGVVEGKVEQCILT